MTWVETSPEARTADHILASHSLNPEALEARSPVPDDHVRSVRRFPGGTRGHGSVRLSRERLPLLSGAPWRRARPRER
jgi:hypothetical protein